MSEPISKIPASPPVSKDSVTAVVDEHGVPLGVEVEINGVGISLPVEQFSSKDSTRADPKAIWIDGHTRREIFVDHVNKTSYVRSIQDNDPASEFTQEVKTVVVVVHMEEGAKAAGGVKTVAEKKPNKEFSPSPVETIVMGGLDMGTPKPHEAHTDAVPAKPSPPVPATTNFASGIFFMHEGNEACNTSAPSSPPKNNAPPITMDGKASQWQEDSAGAQEHPAGIAICGLTPHQFFKSFPPSSGAAYMVTVQADGDGEKRQGPVNSNPGSTRPNSGVAAVGETTRSLRPADSETGAQLPRQVAARADRAPQTTQRASLSDKPPVVCGDEIHSVGAPVAPPPNTASTVLAALKPFSIKDSPSVERPSQTPDSDGEKPDQRGKRDGQHGRQQNPQDEDHPSDEHPMA